MKELKKLCDLLESKDKIISADVILTDENWYQPRMIIERSEKKIQFSGRPTNDFNAAISQIKIASYVAEKIGTCEMSYDISVNIVIPVYREK